MKHCVNNSNLRDPCHVPSHVSSHVYGKLRSSAAALGSRVILLKLTTIRWIFRLITGKWCFPRTEQCTFIQHSVQANVTNSWLRLIITLKNPLTNNPWGLFLRTAPPALRVKRLVLSRCDEFLTDTCIHAQGEVIKARTVQC